MSNEHWTLSNNVWTVSGILWAVSSKQWDPHGYGVYNLNCTLVLTIMV